jgi:hypothetical protein
MPIDFPSSPTNGQVYANYIYDSSITAWRNVNTDTGIGTLNAMGLKNVVPTSVVVSGGSATTNANGTVNFSGSTTVSLNGVFSSTYRNYKIVISQNGTTSANFSFRLRQNGADDSTGNYSFGCYEVPRSGSNLTYQGLDQNFAYISSTSAAQYRGAQSIELQSPYDSTVWTNYECIASDAYYLGLVITGGMYTVGKSFDGITLVASGPMTGTVSIYGYTN